MAAAWGDVPEPRHCVRDKNIEDLVVWAAGLPSSNWNQLQQLVSSLLPKNMAGGAGAVSLPSQIEQATILFREKSSKSGISQDI